METALDMRIYLLDIKKFFKKKGFGFYGKIPLYVKPKSDLVFGEEFVYYGV